MDGDEGQLRSGGKVVVLEYRNPQPGRFNGAEWKEEEEMGTGGGKVSDESFKREASFDVGGVNRGWARQRRSSQQAAAGS